MSLLRYNCHLFLKCFILVFYTVESVKLITILIQIFSPQLGNKVKFLLILQLSITHILLLIICGLFLASQCLLYKAFNKKNLFFTISYKFFPFHHYVGWVGLCLSWLDARIVLWIAWSYFLVFSFCWDIIGLFVPVCDN